MYLISGGSVRGTVVQRGTLSLSQLSLLSLYVVEREAVHTIHTEYLYPVPVQRTAKERHDRAT